MADNTQLNTGTGGDIISTDVVTTLNGGSIATGEKAQRVKVGWGVDGTFNDTNAANPLPISLATAPTTPVTGTFWQTTQPVSGTVTANIGTGNLAGITGTVTVDSELPAAAALSDAQSPTQSVPNVGSAMLAYSSGGAALNRVQTVAATTNSAGTGILATGNLAQFDDVAPTAITENQFGNLRMSANRNLYGTLRDAAGNERGANVTAANALSVDGSAVTQPVSGTVAATQSGTWTVQPGNTANTTPWLVKNITKSVSSQTALTTTATVSGAAGTFQGGSFLNLNSTPAYIQVFDTTGAVTLGTTTPTFVQPIPANATAANGAAYVFDIVGGIGITNGIKIAATTTATGATTVTTGLTGYIAYL